MSELIERVARAVCKAFAMDYHSLCEIDADFEADKEWENWIPEAQAAIAAIQADAAPVATSDWQDATKAAQDVLAGRGNGTYDEALDAIRWLLQSASIHDAPVAWQVRCLLPNATRQWQTPVIPGLLESVRKTGKDEAGIPYEYRPLYAHQPVADRVSTSSPVADARGTDCPAYHDGFHHVDTSMESGPNNCFHCERPI